MSIGSLLLTARDSLIANQMAIDITSANVSNVDTPGYTRQRPVLQSVGSVNVGSASAQLTVSVEQVVRIYDSYIESQLGEQRENSGYSDAMLQGLNNIQLVLDDSQGGGLNEQLNQFWSAWDTLSSNPGGIVERSALVSTAENLCSTIGAYKSDLDSASANMSRDISDIVTQINSKIGEIRDLNARIVGMAGDRGEKNDLLDKQAQALKDLRSMVNVTSIVNADGSINVNLANGDPLVLGVESHPLTVGLDSNGWMNVYSANPIHLPVNNSLTGGKLGAYIELQGTIIPEYISDINEVAGTLAARVNSLHSAGFDANQNTGLAFFTIDADPDKAAATISVNAAIAADTNRIAASASVTGDGEMAGRIAAVRDALSMNGNKATLNSFLAAMVGQIGQQVSEAKTDNDHQTTMLNYLTNQRESISGVSIDEEMINLIKYQMGYNAAGKIVTTTNDLLDTLMGLIR